ncbi:3-oxoacyl-ACP synthase [Mesorhizobium sp. WSM4313]|uniref:3-oxoacyl-ACP synthase n=1 Tax=Mesorhizobium sp. WSM4313 TaxID=2029412 RepID=UPI000BAF734D|nr:3-oxoacyl-ACP synthase [Mesorhizobium sp. WSM4313]PBB20654.1 3-oxoacyl-ACP synthase [Mesorhizobium sp. WSM4313]
MSVGLNIVSIGMVTAVGLDAPSSCAAMRARVDGFQETRFLGPKGEWLVGAPVQLPRNWIGEKRLVHLAAGAINEAFEGFEKVRSQTPLLLCIAEEGRAGVPILDGSRLMRTISQVLESELHEASRIVAHGRPSGHVALDHARKLIASGTASSVMIAGVDSYLSTLTVNHYLTHDRLLTATNANGFIPGEAAAAVLCTSAANNNFSLFGLGLAHELASIYNPRDLPLRGDGMTSAYRGALDECGIEMNRVGYRISDLIGEKHWFKQTALASLRLERNSTGFQDLWSPAESLGNVGAAVVPIMIGMAFTAARKGYAAGNPVLIEASGDDGSCGAALVAARAA